MAEFPWVRILERGVQVMRAMEHKTKRERRFERRMAERQAQAKIFLELLHALEKGDWARKRAALKVRDVMADMGLKRCATPQTVNEWRDMLEGVLECLLLEGVE